jgi:hypothetical protein
VFTSLANKDATRTLRRPAGADIMFTRRAWDYCTQQGKRGGFVPPAQALQLAEALSLLGGAA